MATHSTFEEHPLQPFLPPKAKVLFLGSFPPPREKWSMEFFYPNYINDFWRVWGLLCFNDKAHFERGKAFDREAIEAFATARGMAFFDTARKACRLRGNASDAFLQIVEPTDVEALLTQLPDCHTLVTTGGKASEELQHILSTAGGNAMELPAVGACCELTVWGREMQWYRMPSTSRAFPLPLEEKAAYYRMLMPRLR
ncbi:MAG: uracil-DNA glycosylase family protein [Bacteroidaceae bacterium]|nr:uracil-DNA glycosylase family protein [Bacteroidaceae bacterium]